MLVFYTDHTLKQIKLPLFFCCFGGRCFLIGQWFIRFYIWTSSIGKQKLINGTTFGWGHFWETFSSLFTYTYTHTLCQALVSKVVSLFIVWNLICLFFYFLALRSSIEEVLWSHQKSTPGFWRIYSFWALRNPKKWFLGVGMSVCLSVCRQF